MSVLVGKAKRIMPRDMLALSIMCLAAVACMLSVNLFFSSARSSPRSLYLSSLETTHQQHERSHFLQATYCQEFFPLASHGGSTYPIAKLAVDKLGERISRKPLPFRGMYVIGGGKDIVSDIIMGNGAFEVDEVQMYLKLLEQAETEGIADPLFLDVGSNIGMHTLGVAAFGYRVFAVDAMRHNAHLLRSSLCLNPSLRVTFFNKVVIFDTFPYRFSKRLRPGSRQ